MQDEDNSATLILITAASTEAAKELCFQLVEARSISGANLLTSCTTIYREDDQVLTGTECLILARTLRKKTDEIATIVGNFDSDLEVSVISATQLSASYRAWIDSSISHEGELA